MRGMAAAAIRRIFVVVKHQTMLDRLSDLNKRKPSITLLYVNFDQLITHRI